jgi:hypothetical protein
MADTTLFSRLKKLFSTNTIIRRTKKGLKVIDTDEYQNMTTNLVDRYMKIRMSNTGVNYTESAAAYAQVRIDLFRDYDSMDQDPIIHSAMDIYADESTSKNELGNVLKIHHPDNDVKQILENLFYDILNIEFNIWPWTRNLVKYGDFYLQLEIAPELGIVGIYPMSAYEITRLEGFDRENPQLVKFLYTPYSNPYHNASQTGKKEFQNYEIAHFRLYSDSNFLPYGKSMIEGARRVWKQLSLMEDAMLIHRIMRAPEKRIFKIDVGNIPTNEVDNYMQRIITNSKKVPFIDENTGEYNLKYNMMNLIEDYYLPVRGSDTGTSIDTLKGLEYDMIPDINYLKGKLMAALKIPKAYIGYEEDVNGKATLAAQDIRFAKTIERIQKVIISELTKIAIIHLYSQGIDDERMANFTLELTAPSKIYEQEQVELYTSKINLITAMQQTKMFSKEWMYEAIMKLSKDERDDMTIQVIEDTKQAFRLTQIETTGADPAKPTGTDAPTNVEEELNKIKSELNQGENNDPGRPKDNIRYGKDDHPEGRDPLGIKTLKHKETNIKYDPRKRYAEIFTGMEGKKKKILVENIDISYEDNDKSNETN